MSFFAIRNPEDVRLVTKLRVRFSHLELMCQYV